MDISEELNKDIEYKKTHPTKTRGKTLQKEIKRKIFAHKVASGIKPSQAYKETFSPPNTNTISLRKNASLLLNDGITKSLVIDLLNQQGITITYCNTKLKELLEADKLIVNRKGDCITVKDNPSQIEALKLAYKLHRATDNDNNSSTTNNLNIISTDTAHIESVISKLSKLNIELGLNQDDESIMGIDISDTTVE